MRSRFTPASLSLPSICLALLLCQLATAQERSSPDPSLQKSSPAVLNAFRPVVAKPTQSTVRVQCGGKDVALGTVIGPDGWVLTVTA